VLRSTSGCCHNRTVHIRLVCNTNVLGNIVGIESQLCCKAVGLMPGAVETQLKEARR
jgi:hypothetical protein